MRYIFVAIALCMLTPAVVHAQSCPYDSRCIDNPYGAGNPYDTNSVNNPYGPYGSPYSNESVNNPNATNAPKVYDQDGNYLGRLSNNRNDSESISNPYGRYGNPYSPDSINNPYGAGRPDPRPLLLVPQEPNSSDGQEENYDSGAELDE